MIQKNLIENFGSYITSIAAILFILQVFFQVFFSKAGIENINERVRSITRSIIDRIKTFFTNKVYRTSLVLFLIPLLVFFVILIVLLPRVQVTMTLDELFVFVQLSIIIFLWYNFFFLNVDSSVVDEDFINSVQDKLIVPKLSSTTLDDVRNRVESVIDLWGTILLFWTILYTFMVLVNEGIIPLTELWNSFVLRVLNMVDTLQFILLFTFFRQASNQLTTSKIFRHINGFITAILFLLIADISAILLGVDTSWLTLFAISGAVLSATAFILFFGKLDSIFVQLPKYFLIILVFYGVWQSLYPLELMNYFESKSFGMFCFWFGIVVSVLGKLFLGIIFTSRHYVRSLYFYFACYFTFAKPINTALKIRNDDYLY